MVDTSLSELERVINDEYLDFIRFRSNKPSTAEINHNTIIPYIKEKMPEIKEILKQDKNKEISDETLDILIDYINENVIAGEEPTTAKKAKPKSTPDPLTLQEKLAFIKKYNAQIKPQKEKVDVPAEQLILNVTQFTESYLELARTVRAITLKDFGKKFKDLAKYYKNINPNLLHTVYTSEYYPDMIKSLLEEVTSYTEDGKLNLDSILKEKQKEITEHFKDFTEEEIKAGLEKTKDSLDAVILYMSQGKLAFPLTFIPMELYNNLEDLDFTILKRTIDLYNLSEILETIKTERALFT